MIQIDVSFNKASKKLMASAKAIRREQAEQILSDATAFLDTPISEGAPIANNNNVGDPAMAKHDALASTNNNNNVDPAMAEHDALASPDNNKNKIEDPALTTQDVTASLTNSKGDPTKA
jgi:hypothetical protein